MDLVSAPNIVDAPAKPASFAAIINAVLQVERFLEQERSQLPLWLVVAFGSGIAAWMVLAGPGQWSAFIILSLGGSAAGLGLRGRAGRSLAFVGLGLALGCGLVWLRSNSVAAPRLDRPRVAAFEARVDRVEVRAAKGDVRLTLKTTSAGLPPILRISAAERDVPEGLRAGALVEARAYLQPPPPMALPGGHDFARDSWFLGIGGVGRSLGKVRLLKAGGEGRLDDLRDRLGRHIRARLPGGAGGIATALATGDQGAIGEEDAEAMRRSGLAHLLSVSGLHIAALVGAVMVVALRLLALSERLALRFNLILLAAGFGAAAGIAYTLLTGMQVPTIRSCIAALLVMAGMALGREAIGLRLVGVAALLVMVVRPESLAGASFQMSFAAVVSIIALHRIEAVKRWLGPREEGLPARACRALAGLVLTGLAVEAALMPFALYHFHRAGLYSVGANLIAIPLTTFAMMPLEALALLLDPLGLSAPFWALAGSAIDWLLRLAHAVGAAEGAVAMVPTMPRAAFGAMVLGGLWLCIWVGKIRWLGFVPVLAGAVAAALQPVPDLLVAGKGQHLALVRADGVPVLLRSRTGDFMRDLMSEASAYDGDPLILDEQAFARCSREACIADLERGGRRWRLLAIRSRDRIGLERLAAACRDSDIVVADRRLPRACTPRWLKLDGPALERLGGVAIVLAARPEVASVAARLGDHPWAH